jgi:diguanylate cyclase (GGDEF)-like protein/PAS domain S-box-containing protein
LDGVIARDGRANRTGDSIPAEPADARRDDAPFWHATVALGFAILTAESLVVVSYLLATPRGEHRFALELVASGAAAAGIIGAGLAPSIARHRSRVQLMVTFTIASALLLSVCGLLDGGVESPLMYLGILPVMYAGLLLPPQAVHWCGAATLASFVIVGLVLGDPDSGLPHTNLVLLSATLAGAVTLAIGVARHRGRLESARATLTEELRRRAATDGLTGCWNQRTFQLRLQEEVDRALRYGHPLTLIMCDVDHFRQFNDMFGHDVGDEALTSVGARLRSCARTSDVVARVGGDEFAVLLPETSATDAAGVAHRMLATGDATLSIGVAALDDAEPTAKRLFRDADAALYQAKDRGRNTVVTAGSGGVERWRRTDPTDADMVDDRKRGAEALRQAQREKVETELVLDTLLRESPVGFAVVDRESRTIRVNASFAAITGSTLDEQLGRRLADSAPQLWTMLQPLYEQVIHDGIPVRDLEVVSPPTESDLEGGAWLANLYPVRVGRQRIGVGIVVVDITDCKRLEHSQEALTDAVVSALVAAVEARDPYTAGHQRRVEEIATALATETGCDPFTVKGISLAAAIHDIGKAGVPAEILSRPGRLSDAEMELVRGHAETGYQILHDIEFAWPVAEMVRQHHERLDGSGYPAGLRGEQVSLGARIIAVADVVEAMAAHRPYRPALGIDAALATIQQGRGELFDPTVVDACVRLFHDGRLAAQHAGTAT